MNYQISQFGNKKPLGLGGKFISLVVVILLITLTAALYVNYTIQKSNFTEQLEIRGKSLGNFIALTSTDAVLGQDFLLLNQFMKEISHQPDVVYGVILAENNDNLTSYLNHESVYIKSSPHSDFLMTIDYLESQPDIITMVFPIMAADQIGTVKLGISTKQISRLSKNALQQQFAEIISIISFLSICIFILFRLNVVKPIQELVYSFKHVSEGNLDHKAKIIADDELGTLAHSFNKMTASLKEMHNEKDRVVEQLKTTNDELEAATKAKSDFLANMSHEIRTPLNAIIGFAEAALYMDHTAEELDASLNTIVRSGHHLIQIINNILDLSKVESGHMTVELLNESPFTVINDVEMLMRPKVEQKGLSFHVDYNYPLPAEIKTDPVKLKQILINLCGNAIKFTHTGQVKISVDFLQDKNKLRFAVIDSGIGLDEEQQNIIFQPFTQADVSTTRKYGGTGLGLSLSRQLVGLLGGKLTVKSQVDAGSRFEFDITVDEFVKDRLIKSVNEIPMQQSHRHGSNYACSIQAHVLVVDDTEDNQKLMHMLLQKMGITVSLAGNGQEALDIINTNEKTFDLVFMDMQMPVMDGYTAVRLLREQGYQQPIVALTADVMRDNEKKYKEIGCDDFLSKPVDHQALLNLLHHFLQNSQVKPADTDFVSQLLLEDPEFAELVNGFIKRLPAELDGIQADIKNKNWQELKFRVHTLKGVAANLGYQQLADAMLDIELTIQREDVDHIDGVFPRLEEIVTNISEVQLAG